MTSSGLSQLKILQGTLKETLYDWPDAPVSRTSPLNIRRETLLHENDAAYMSDKLGLHKISNPDPHRPAISLHRMHPTRLRLMAWRLTRNSVYPTVGGKERMSCVRGEDWKGMPRCARHILRVWPSNAQVIVPSPPSPALFMMKRHFY